VHIKVHITNIHARDYKISYLRLQAIKTGTYKAELKTKDNGANTINDTIHRVVQNKYKYY